MIIEKLRPSIPNKIELFGKETHKSSWVIWKKVTEVSNEKINKTDKLRIIREKNKEKFRIKFDFWKLINKLINKAAFKGNNIKSNNICAFLRLRIIFIML